MHRSGESAWAKGIRRPSEIHSFLEGPLLAGESLLVADVAWGRVFAVGQTGQFDLILDYDGAPNGLAATGDSGVVIADAHHGLVWTLASDGSLERGLVLERRQSEWLGESFHGLNDLIVWEDGSIVATDQGSSGLHEPYGRIVHLHPDGTEVTLLDRLPSPNGLALVPGKAEVLVALTRDNSIWRVPFTEDLRPFRVGRFVQLSGGVGPDGIAMTPDGWLFVAHLGLGVVWMIDPEGRTVGAFEAPEGMSTSNVVHDANSDVIYVTEADTGSVLVADVSMRW